MADFFRTYGFLIVSMTLQAILALSLYLPMMAGQLSLASPGFYALGGYTAAILSTRVFPSSPGVYSFPYLLIEIGVAVVICCAIGVVVGFIALRLRGIYLALATIAFTEIISVLAVQLVDLTGGAPGIDSIPQPFSSQFGYILLTLPLLVIITFMVFRIERIRVGRAFIALREDELAAASLGINPMVNKVLAFTLGAGLAGLAGAISAHLFNTWNPNYGTFDDSILLLAYVLVGGSLTVFGPVAGALILTALPEVLRGMAGIAGMPEWLAQFLLNGRLIIFGILILVGTLFFPQGLLRPELFLRRKSQPPGAPQPVSSPIPEVPK